MGHLVQDLLFARRSFGRTPGAALLAVATLAIGIGANAAIFSVIHRVLLDPLPYERADRLALAWRQNPAVGGVQVSPSRADAERWRSATTIEGLTIFSGKAFTLEGGDEPEQVVARTIEPGIFNFLGVRPAIGRPFTAADTVSAAAARVVLLGDALFAHGVISYSVGQRTQEIGLRMALGALPRDIRRSVVGEAVLLAGIGLAAGVAGALLLTRVMQSMLFEVSATDPASFVVTMMVLGGTALIAAWVPARRAMRVDPMIALRAE